MPSHATIVAPPPEKLNLREKILLAALTIETETFRIGRLAVRAWERYPADFALDDEPHPDSNVVIAKLSGADGLVGLGWFERVAPGTFRVTQTGRNHVIDLDVRGREQRNRERKASEKRASRQKAIATGPLTEREIVTVARLAKSPVLGRYRSAHALTAADAQEFWFRSSHAAVEALIDRATDTIMGNPKPDGRIPNVGTLGTLRNLNSVLALRFPRT